LIGEGGVRSPALLASAAGQPYQSFDGHDLFPTIFEKAAVLIRSIAQNQPFVDGNKRTAWAAGRTLLRANGITVHATADEIVGLFLALAAKIAAVEDVVEFLIVHSETAPPEVSALELAAAV
jgi:death-on-curing protein